MNNSLADKQVNESDTVEFEEAKKIYNDHKETCNTNIANYNLLGYCISIAANIGRSGFNEFAALMQAVDTLLNATNRIAMNRATRLRIQEQDGALNVSDLRAKKAEAVAEKAEAALNSCLTVFINKGISKEISQNGYSRERMITLTTELTDDVVEMASKLTHEQARGYIEECIRNHPQIPRTATVSANPSGLFTQASPTRNTDAARPSAEAENSYARRTN